MTIQTQADYDAFVKEMDEDAETLLASCRTEQDTIIAKNMINEMRRKLAATTFGTPSWSRTIISKSLFGSN